MASQEMPSVRRMAKIALSAARGLLSRSQPEVGGRKRKLLCSKSSTVPVSCRVPCCLRKYVKNENNSQADSTKKSVKTTARAQRPRGFGRLRRSASGLTSAGGAKRIAE